MARKATVWIKNWSYSASHMGGLGELDEDRQELEELEEQLGESVECCLGLGESGRGVLTFSGWTVNRRVEGWLGELSEKGLRIVGLGESAERLRE